MKRGAFISFSDVSSTENESVSSLPSDNTSGPPPVYSGEHAELLLTSKKLLKKDDVTKLKALDELLKLEEYILIDFIPHYCYLFKRLSYDNNRQIREKMCLLLNKLVSNNSKLFTPYMKDIYPTWWVLMSDPCREVSQAAINAYNTAIPIKKRTSVLCYLSNSLLKVINLHLSATPETIASIAGDRTLSPEEEEERYERVTVSTLHALKSILESVPPPPPPTTTFATAPSEDLLKIFQIDNTPLLSPPTAKPDKKEASATPPNPSKQLIISIWKLTIHKFISIRQASYVALREFAVRLPIIYNTMKTTTLAQKVIHIVNNEKVDALLQSALDTTVNLLSHCEGIWEYISLSELLKPSILHHLTSAVASGGGGGEGLGVVGQVGSLDRAVTVLEYIVPLIGSFPPSLLAIRSPSSVKYRADIITLLLPPLQALVHAEVATTPPPSTRYLTQHKRLKVTAMTTLLELALLLLLRRTDASDTTATLGDEAIDQAYVSTVFSVLRDSITLALNHIIHVLGPVHIGADYTQQLKSSHLFISLQKVCLQLHRATVQGIQFPPSTWNSEVWLHLIETFTHLRDSYLLPLAAGEGERETHVSQGYLVKCSIEGYMANKVHIQQALLSLWMQSFAQASAPHVSSTQSALKQPAGSVDQGMNRLFTAIHHHSHTNLTQLSTPQGNYEVTFDEQLMCSTLQSDVVSSVLQSLLHLKLLLASRPSPPSASESTDDQVLTGGWLMNALTLYTHLDTFLSTYPSKDSTQLSATLLPDLYEILYNELGKYFQYLASARLQGMHGLDSESGYMALYVNLLELIVSSSSVSLFNMLHATAFIPTHLYVKPTIGGSPQESNASFLQWKHNSLTTLVSTNSSAPTTTHNKSDDKVEPISDVTKSRLTFIVNCLLDELSCGEDSDAEKVISTLYTAYKAWQSGHSAYYSHILINVYRRVCLNSDGPQYDKVLALYILTDTSTTDEADAGVKIDLSSLLTHLFFAPSPAVVPQIKADTAPSALFTGQELLLTWDDVETTLLPLLPVDQCNAIHETLLSHISLVTYDKTKPLYSSPAVWVGYFIKILDMLQRQQDSNWTLISTKSPPSGPINRYPSQPRTTLTQSSLFHRVGLFHTEDMWHEWSTKLIDCFNVLHYDAALKSVTSQLDLFVYTLQALSQLRRYVLYNIC